MPHKKPAFGDYYWGALSRGGISFREDINRAIPPARKRSHVDDPKDVIFNLWLQDEGVPFRSMKGWRRDYFLVALYFTALIDQGIYHYYRRFHRKYDRLTIPPKICTTVDNVHPNFLFQAEFGWSRWTKSRLALFSEAEKVFRKGFRTFAKTHLSGLDPQEAWAKYSRHYPPQFSSLGA